MSPAEISTMRNRTIALAGLFQAVYLVKQTARGELRDDAATRTCLESLRLLEPASVEAVYGNTNDLDTGLRILAQQLGGGRGQRDLELTSYAISLMYLERKLERNAGMLDAIRREIGLLDERHGDSFATSEAVASLADIYAGTISNIKPRIMVQGNPDILSADASRNMIRALLLAGIRACVLWRQCGGSRWMLIFRRKSLLKYAQRL